MKNIIFFLFLTSICQPLFSQKVLTTPSVNQINDGLISNNNRYGSKVGKGEVSYEEILLEYETFDGSPFLHNGEITVDLIYFNDSIIKDIKIRYDLYHDEIIAKSVNGNTVVLDQLYYKGFTCTHEGVKETYLRVHPEELKYFKVLYQNEDFVFSQDIDVRISEDTRYVPGQQAKNKKFVQNKHYIIIQDELVSRTKLRKDALVEYLPWKYRSKVPELKKQLKIRKLNKEVDYVSLMNLF